MPKLNTLVLAMSLVITMISISACGNNQEMTALQSDESPVVEVTEVMEATPTATEIPMSTRPDFESMSDEELILSVDEYSKFFAEQIDCSPGIAGLPTASHVPVLQRVSSNGYFVTWKTEYLGSYKAMLTGKDGLPAGHIVCLYFASSEPGGVISVSGGGELWGEELSCESYVGYADHYQKMMVIGREYELEIFPLSANWDSPGGKEKHYPEWVERFGYIDGPMRIMIGYNTNDIVGNRLGLIGGVTSTSGLLTNFDKPIYAHFSSFGY